MSHFRKKLGKDESAGIEGMPLQLMIMVVIAGIGMAVMLGWMSGLNAPNGIGSVHSSPSEIVLSDGDKDGIYTKSGFSISITATDKAGDPIKGATVVLDGASLNKGDGKQVHGTTDELGKATFTGLSASQNGQTIGFITVTVTKGDMGTDDSLKIPVISE